MPKKAQYSRLIKPGEFDPRDWDGDPKTLTDDVVEQLRTDEWLANNLFANKTEAFVTGLALGLAAARRQTS